MPTSKKKLLRKSKGEDEKSSRLRAKILYFLFISLASCSLVLSPVVSLLRISFSLFYSVGNEKQGFGSDTGVDGLPCSLSTTPNDTICCDRSNIKYDTCVMKGDIRTHPSTTSLILYSNKKIQHEHEMIRPYTRKWETEVMERTVTKVDLIVRRMPDTNNTCDVHHDVPAVVFSTGGFTGNLFHEFNDGTLPLFITTQHLNRRVVFVILDYHDWWIMKYSDIVTQLSDFPPIYFSSDPRVHCFPEAIVGLTIHEELSVNPTLMPGNKTIFDFHDLLDKAYRPRIKNTLKPITQNQKHRPKLTIIARNGSRSITNQESLTKVAEKIGFMVEVLYPGRTTDLAVMYGALNSTHVMAGVHGAAMTHFLFMRPGSVFIQIVPLGTDWSSKTYYEDPARKLGLKYIGYKIMPNESSLYEKYNKYDPVLMNPDSFAHKGWEFTKKIYLVNQNVTLDLDRFRDTLLLAYNYTHSPQNFSHLSVNKIL